MSTFFHFFHFIEPYQVGLPDPPGFSDELLKRRDIEREFLSQLLDGSKVEMYTLPVKINAELRKYQQDGVNWLAFLAKYQLHGILCDGMLLILNSLNCHPPPCRHGTR